MSKERPILFAGPMVRAILDGRKTQTRRILGNKKVWPSDIIQDSEIIDGKERALGFVCSETGEWYTTESQCPFGKPGDRLWVRETFGKRLDGKLYYRADQTLGQFNVERWRPSIHMPRSVSRITLEITGVRVERLNEISEADAIREGVEFEDGGDCGHPGGFLDYRSGDDDCSLEPVPSFQSLWESINGAGSWDANPWVWVVEFKKLEQAALEAA